MKAKLERLDEDEDAEKHLDTLRPMIPQLKELRAQAIRGGLLSEACKTLFVQEIHIHVTITLRGCGACAGQGSDQRRG